MTENTNSPPVAPKRTGLPLLGSAVSFARDPYTFYDEMADYGDVVRFNMGHHEMAAILHPDIIKQVLVEDNDQFRKPADAGGVDVLSEGLLLSDGEQWNRQRSQLQPLFYRERIQTYAETMGVYAAAATDDWSAAEGAVDLSEITSTYTLRVLGKTLFGIETDRHRQAIRAGAEAIRERSSESPVSVNIPDWLPTPSNQRYERGIDQLDDVVDELLAERQTGDNSDDLLSMLLTASKEDTPGPSEAELRSQLITFLFAGHETSATALTWALYELGRKPDVADRLRDEVDTVIDTPHAKVGDLPDLEYTDQVLRETLRRYPPAAAIFRETDAQVTVDGYRLPADTYIVLPQFHVHTDDRWWDEPRVFNPSRWDNITEPPGDRPEYAYFPFGGGPRHCIGMRFARMELKLALATIMRRCRVTHDIEAVEADIGSTVSPDQSVPVRFERRKS